MWWNIVFRMSSELSTRNQGLLVSVDCNKRGRKFPRRSTAGGFWHFKEFLKWQLPMHMVWGLRFEVKDTEKLHASWPGVTPGGRLTRPLGNDFRLHFLPLKASPVDSTGPLLSWASFINEEGSLGLCGTLVTAFMVLFSRFWFLKYISFFLFYCVRFFASNLLQNLVSDDEGNQLSWYFNYSVGWGKLNWEC